MRTSTQPARTRSTTTLSIALPRWDTSVRYMGTVSPTAGSRTPRQLYLLCTPTRRRPPSTWPHIGLGVHTKQLYYALLLPNVPLSAHTLSRLSRLQVLQLGALVRYVVFIVNVVVGITLPANGPSFFPLSPLPLRFAVYIVDFSTRTKTCGADPVCFYIPLAVRLQVRSPCYVTIVLISYSVHRCTDWCRRRLFLSQSDVDDHPL